MYIGCSTHPPENPLPDVSTGKVFVSSNINGADIYINGTFTGKLTPDTVTAPTGTVNILLQKTGYLPSVVQAFLMKDSLLSVYLNMNAAVLSNTVILEEFSNVSCIPCVTTNRILNSLHTSGFTNEQLIIVKYSSNFPSPQDPHYLHSKPDFDGRMSYYSIISTPTIFVNGNTSPVASDSNSIKGAINTELAEGAKFILSVSDSSAGGNLYIKINLNNTDSAGINFNRLTLHTLIVEDEITYISPPGANGETSFKHVVRKMVPSKDGENLAPSLALSTAQVNHTVAINGQWNMQKIKTVVFVQDKITKKIYQAASSK